MKKRVATLIGAAKRPLASLARRKELARFRPALLDVTAQLQKLSALSPRERYQQAKKQRDSLRELRDGMLEVLMQSPSPLDPALQEALSAAFEGTLQALEQIADAAKDISIDV